MRSLDVAVIVAYFAAVMAFGLLLAGRQRDATDYFLGHRGLPWWALMMSVVATETSAVTVISVPGLAARGDLTFLQVAFGYLVGRIGVAKPEENAADIAVGIRNDELASSLGPKTLRFGKAPLALIERRQHTLAVFRPNRANWHCPRRAV